LFENGKLKSNTHAIWMKISEQLHFKVTPLNLFISVYKDRHDFQTKLKKSLNIEHACIFEKQMTDEEIASNELNEENHEEEIENYLE